MTFWQEFLGYQTFNRVYEFIMYDWVIFFLGVGVGFVSFFVYFAIREIQTEDL